MLKEKTKIEQLAEEVLTFSRNTLLVNLRFLDMALNQLKLQSTDSSTMMTDGQFVFYEPRNVLTKYKTRRESIAHDYLHMVQHCVYRHMFVGPQLDRTLWDLACDIAVENVIAELQLTCVSSNRKQQQCAYIAELKKELKNLTAEKIYSYLKRSDYSTCQISEMANDFCTDDHTIWYKSKDDETNNKVSKESSKSDNTNDENNKNTENGEVRENEKPSQSSQPQKEIKSDNAKDSETNDNARGESSGSNNVNGGTNEKADGEGENSPLNCGGNSNAESWETSCAELEAEWKKISERMQGEVENFVKSQGARYGALIQNLNSVNREKYDYTSFLKRFAVMGEVMKVNDDEFDCIFYTYGLKLYNKMPLIEPLEYKEEKRIKEFVLAIDTSGSTSGELVQKFVQKTYNILKNTESFFSKVNLHIIQCDAKVQEHVKITSQGELNEYIKTMKIHGLGGTDFRPVFEFTDKLISQREFTHLKGLIYFTDGWGTFPLKKPSYEAAFVYIDDEYSNYEVPSWAIKLVLKAEEI